MFFWRFTRITFHSFSDNSDKLLFIQFARLIVSAVSFGMSDVCLCVYLTAGVLRCFLGCSLSRASTECNAIDESLASPMHCAGRAFGGRAMQEGESYYHHQSSPIRQNDSTSAWASPRQQSKTKLICTTNAAVMIHELLYLAAH